MLPIEHVVFGKSDVQGIVSMEIEDDKCYVWTELDGKVEKQTLINQFWILANQQPRKDWVRMKGDLHYKWGKQYSDSKEYRKMRNVLQNNDIYSIYNDQEANMVKDGHRYFRDLKVADVSVLSFDIETTGLDVNKNSKVLLISNTYRSKNRTVKRMFSYEDYACCGDMIADWASWVVHEIDPSIILGHNILNFDLKFLYDSCKRDRVPFMLGRENNEIFLSPKPRAFRVDGGRALDVNKFRVYGRELCDTYLLAQRYDQVEKNYETYGLKYIIAKEGLEKPGRVFYDAAKIRDNYTNPIEWSKIKEYCVDDADDALALYDKMISSSFYVNQSVPKTFTDLLLSATGAQINSVLVSSYLQDQHSIPKATDLSEVKVEGGISFAVPGIYRNLLKVDLKSAYPSQILRFKLHDKQKDPDANFYRMVEFFANQRFALKKKYNETKELYYKDMDASAKIFINSSYGVTNTSGLNFNSLTLASIITEETRKVIDLGLRWASGQGKDYWMQKFFDIVGKDKDAEGILSIGTPLDLNITPHDFIIGPTDTDSISFSKKDMSEFSVDEIKLLHKEIAEISPEFMEWELDGGNMGQFDTCIAFKAKNYVLFDPTDKPGKQVKIKGSAIKSSKNEKAVKEFQTAIVQSILDRKDNYTEIYNQYVKEALNKPDMSRWVSKKTLSATTYDSLRPNETKIIDAIQGTEYKEGDRVFLFFKKDGSLCLLEKFDGEYDEMKLIKRVYDSAKVFKLVFPEFETMFPKYSLKKNLALLETV